jgi:hypothetical protein
VRDINEPVRVAYAAALLQIPGMGVYYQGLPDNLNPDNYIVFRSINLVDDSNKHSPVVNLNITIEIHTKNNIKNPGLTADTIADQVYQLVYPDKQTNLTLSRGQIIWTQIANDRVDNITQRNQFGYIDRFITFRHRISIDSTGSGGGGQTTYGQLFRLEYTGIGGESGFTDTQLINKSILAVWKDGIEFSEIITSGLPVNKQVKYNSVDGSILFAITIEPTEEIAVLYQLNNQFQTLVFDYTATGGELSFTDPTIENKSVYGVSRDGVSASKILSSGTPTGKEALYELDGTITFASALEPGEQVKVLYQL